MNRRLQGRRNFFGFLRPYQNFRWKFLGQAVRVKREMQEKRHETCGDAERKS